MILDAVLDFKKFFENYNNETPVFFYNRHNEGPSAIKLVEQRTTNWSCDRRPDDEEHFRKKVADKLRGLFLDEETIEQAVDESMKATALILNAKTFGWAEYFNIKQSNSRPCSAQLSFADVLNKEEYPKILDTAEKFKKFFERYNDETPVLFYDYDEVGAFEIEERYSHPSIKKEAACEREELRFLIANKMRGLFSDEETLERFVNEAMKASTFFLMIKRIGETKYNQFKYPETRTNDVEDNK